MSMIFSPQFHGLSVFLKRLRSLLEFGTTLLDMLAIFTYIMMMTAAIHPKTAFHTLVKKMISKVIPIRGER